METIFATLFVGIAFVFAMLSVMGDESNLKYEEEECEKEFAEKGYGVVQIIREGPGLMTNLGIEYKLKETSGGKIENMLWQLYNIVNSDKFWDLGAGAGNFVIVPLGNSFLILSENSDCEKIYDEYKKVKQEQEKVIGPISPNYHDDEVRSVFWSDFRNKLKTV